MSRWSRGVLSPDFFSGFGYWEPVPRGSSTEVTPDSREKGEAGDTRGAGVLLASGAPQSPSDPLWGFTENQRMSVDLSVVGVCVSSLFLLSLESSRILFGAHNSYLRQNSLLAFQTQKRKKRHWSPGICQRLKQELET